jgi:hypothetical protein
LFFFFFYEVSVTDFLLLNRPNTVLMFVFMEQLQRLVGVSTGQPKAVSEKKASEAMKA